MKYTAKLIRGDNYFLGKKRFVKGEAKEITEEEKGFIDKAVDHFTVGGEDFTKPKFEVEEVADEGEDDKTETDPEPKEPKKKTGTTTRSRSS